MNILITGCNGQLGNELQLLEPAYPHHHFFNTDVADLDITDFQAVRAYISNHQIDGVVNCAAFTAVDKAETPQALCRQLNTEAPSFLAEAIHAQGGFMIHISTDYVFDGQHCVPYQETDTPCPTSTYGVTKLAGEQAVMEHCP